MAPWGAGRLISTALLLLAVSWVEAAVDAGEPLYQRALQQARQGQHSEALQQFRTLIRDYPDNLRYQYDYLATLGWAQQDRQVIDFASRLDLERAPPYVLETVGKSARNVKDYALAEHVYRMAVNRSPLRLQANLGLAYALAENLKPAEALAILEPLTNRYPDNIEILDALAFTYRAYDEEFKALKTYERILALQPGHREARRGRIFVTAQLGAPHLALDMADKAPGLLTPTERQALRHDRTAHWLRWSQLYQPDPQQRYEQIDAAIDELDALQKALEQSGQSTSPAAHAVANDRVVALADRKRFHDAIRAYEALQENSVPVTAYAHRAGASAYLAQRQPEAARDIYLALLAQQPDHFQDRLGLFYSYMDIPDYDGALETAQQLKNMAHARPAKSAAARRTKQADQLSADIAVALAQAWTDNLAAAATQLTTLEAQAPYNARLHTELGYVYLWRGWPRRALNAFDLANNIDTEAVPARVGKVAAQRAVRQYQNSEQSLLSLERGYADDDGVRKQRRAWDIHNKRQLRIEAFAGDSNGQQFGSRNATLDGWLYSRPLDYRYRIYARGHIAYADFIEGPETYQRYGAGIEYRVPDWILTGELSTGYGDYTDTGARAVVTWLPDDHWTLSGGVDSYSNDVPLRGRLNEAIEGKSAQLDADYRFHESRALSAGAQFIDMSDGNERTSASGAFFQRLVTQPRYKLDSWLRLYGSKNTRQNASYFNPERDSSITVTLRNEWLVQRRYSSQFFHRLGFTLGQYKQKNFDSGAMWTVNYEHHWFRNDTFELLYGIARSRHPYDGVDEDENQVYLTLDWRF
jgi:biofilm PGA synthesis protein PgaA